MAIIECGPLAFTPDLPNIDETTIWQSDRQKLAELPPDVLEALYHHYLKEVGKQSSRGRKREGGQPRRAQSEASSSKTSTPNTVITTHRGQAVTPTTAQLPAVVFNPHTPPTIAGPPNRCRAMPVRLRTRGYVGWTMGQGRVMSFILIIILWTVLIWSWVSRSWGRVRSEKRLK